MDLEDKDGLTPLMHGLLAVRSSMDSESAVRAVSVLAQHSKPGSLQRQEDRGLGHNNASFIVKFLEVQLQLLVGVYHDPKGSTIFKMVVNFRGNAALYDALLDALPANQMPRSGKFGRRIWKQWSRTGLPAAPS